MSDRLERHTYPDGTRMVFDPDRCRCGDPGRVPPCRYCEHGGHEDEDDPPRGMVALGRRAKPAPARAAYVWAVLAVYTAYPRAVGHEPWNLPHPPQGSRGIGWSPPLAMDEEG